MALTIDCKFPLFLFWSSCFLTIDFIFSNPINTTTTNTDPPIINNNNNSNLIRTTIQQVFGSRNGHQATDHSNCSCSNISDNINDEEKLKQELYEFFKSYMITKNCTPPTSSSSADDFNVTSTQQLSSTTFSSYTISSIYGNSSSAQSLITNSTTIYETEIYHTVEPRTATVPEPENNLISSHYSSEATTIEKSPATTDEAVIATATNFFTGHPNDEAVTLHASKTEAKSPENEILTSNHTNSSQLANQSLESTAIPASESTTSNPNKNTDTAETITNNESARFASNDDKNTTPTTSSFQPTILPPLDQYGSNNSSATETSIPNNTNTTNRVDEYSTTTPEPFTSTSTSSIGSVVTSYTPKDDAAENVTSSAFPSSSGQAMVTRTTTSNNVTEPEHLPNNDHSSTIENREQEIRTTNHHQLHQSINTTTKSDIQPPATYRVCFQNIESIQTFLSNHILPVPEPANIYLYYYVPPPEQSHIPHEYILPGHAYQPDYNYKHYYTPLDEHSANSVYSAFSLDQHRTISGYLANQTPSKAQPQKVKPYCIDIPLNTTTSLNARSMENENNEEFSSVRPSPTPPPAPRNRKFYYKKPKDEMPFEMYSKENCNSQSFICHDGTACIPEYRKCDGIINCKDLSDELDCTCRDRMDKNKICDGFFDCPTGDDESGCFGCSKNSFSCDDWSIRHLNATCVPIAQRCDGRRDCDNGKDELECEALTEIVANHQIHFASYTSGYLHRNYRGKWYPVCGHQHEEWALRACKSEIGLDVKHADIELLPFHNSYYGKFIESTPYHGIQFLDGCNGKNYAIHVKCPPIPCGTRVQVENFTPKYRWRRGTTSESRKKRDSRKADPKEVDILAQALKNIFTQSNVFPFADEKVVGGKWSHPGNWPWLVAIQRDGKLHCGGVILHESWIITAAHCLSSYENHYYEVQAGILRRYSFSPSEQTKKITHLIIHPSYTTPDMKNDIALVRLDSPLKFNRWIRPICLPEGRPPWGPLPGTMCTAVGWGSTVEHGSNPDNVKEVELPILPHCKHFPDIQGDEICAGYLGGKFDTCQGDSGGPLLCRASTFNDRWYVAGVVSHGEGCARPNEPGAYTRVALFLPWIIKHADDHAVVFSRSPKQQCPGLRCPHGGRCVALNNICDGVIDCLGAEDEQGCGYPPQDDTQRNADDNLFNSTPPNQKHDHHLGEKKSAVAASSPDTFVCTKIHQEIKERKYCDGEVDCQDGTDEIDCKCSDFVRNYNSSQICDGIIQCHDSTDEKNCLDICSNTQFYCYKSSSCIERNQVCDKTKDCPNGEDEQHCYTVVPFTSSTSGYQLELDIYGVPAFSERGFIARNIQGHWKPVCVSAENELENELMYDKLASDLGFKKKQCQSMIVPDTDLFNSTIVSFCDGINANFKYIAFIDDQIHLPWRVQIYINGIPSCFGLLVQEDWVLIEPNCETKYDQSKDYMVAVFGDVTSKIRSPYEQIISITYANYSKTLQLMVGRLKRAPRITQYTRVIKTLSTLPSDDPNSVCLLILNGFDHTYHISVRAEKDQCPPAAQCYKIQEKNTVCKKSNNKLNLGGVICNKKGESYLSTTIQGENDQFCLDPTNTLQLHSAENVSSFIASQNSLVTSTKTNKKCIDGFRCELGNCIPWSQMNDGKPDCRTYEDENYKFQKDLINDDKNIRTTRNAELNNLVHVSRNSRDTIDHGQILQSPCKNNELERIESEDNLESHPTKVTYCKIYEFKCQSGECASVAQICDGNKDCLDGSDEPDDCENFTCATYLNFTSPSKLCDKNYDCLDKSDEHPNICHLDCTSNTTFNCSESSTCIPLEYVCDGERDCAHGDDEMKCIRLEYSDNVTIDEATIFIQSKGKWEPLCMTDGYISFDSKKLCQQLGYEDVEFSKTIRGKKEIQSDDLLTTITLNSGKEVVIKNHNNRSNYNNTTSFESCEYLHLKCKQNKTQ